MSFFEGEHAVAVANSTTEQILNVLVIKAVLRLDLNN
jgi:hypothetical protein